MSDYHAGKYTCRAENNGGSAESTADLVVKKKHLSPVFLRRLQSQGKVLGQKIVLEVEIGGFPLPQVTWYLNEEQVISNSSRQIREQGSHFLLVVPNARVSQLVIFNIFCEKFLTFRTQIL